MGEAPLFFLKGPRPLARLLILSSLSLGLMVGDAHVQFLVVVRQGIAAVIHPLQQLALSPFDLAARIGDFFVTHAKLQRENVELKHQALLNSAQLQRYRALLAENAYLRRLLEVRAQRGGRVVVGELIHGVPEPFARKIVVDKGVYHGVSAGRPVIDYAGVVGQITRVYPFSSEITLLTDPSLAVPVHVLRNGIRAVTFGDGQSGLVSLPYMPANADVKIGDTLVTSGIDGVYPAGLPVAVVEKIERDTASAFARITCVPSAGVGQHEQLLILLDGPQPSATANTEAGTAVQSGQLP
ncbi:MAG: rod shape-determining protein MreC [Burkholderiales bacterium]